jgi:transposase
MAKARDRRRTLDGFAEINHDAAGIDVGNAQHWVAVPAGRDAESVRMFGCFTADLHALANWLERCGIKTVALESTGVYWIALYEVLESRGFKVCVVNARQAKNLPGRKTDVKDCQWLQQLHTRSALRRSPCVARSAKLARSFAGALSAAFTPSPRPVRTASPST